MPKLLLIDMGAAWGGQEIYSQKIARRLIDNGWTVTHLSAHERHNSAPGTHWIPISVKYSDFPQTRSLVNRLQAMNDIVHFNGTRAMYLSALLRKKSRFIATKHSPFQMDDETAVRAGIAAAASWGVFYNIDDLICVSPRIAAELPATVQKRTLVIRNGVDDLGCGDIPRFQGSIPRFCYIGRIYESKGLMRLVAAARSLHERGLDFHLTIAGRGPLLETLQTYVLQNNLSSKVTLPGFTDNPAQIYRSSDVCVLPSIYEGLPLSLLEAMSSGCALIGHPIPGVLEVIRDGDNGLVADVNENALADAMARLISDAPLREKLRSRARKDYEDHWGSDRMWESTLQVYERVQSTGHGN